MQPIVSVVMPAFCAVATLERAARSVLDQNFRALELVIVDDASPDSTLAVAERLARQDDRVVVLRLPRNEGAAVARNLAIDHARGRYLAFLDADDEWLPEKLSVQIAAMEAAGATLGYSAFFRQSASGRHLVQVPASVTYAQLLRGNVIGCLTAMVDRDGFDGPLQMPLLRRRQDFAFWLLLLRRGAISCGIQVPLAIHHRTENSLSSPRIAALRATWHVYRGAEGLSVPRSVWLLASHLLRRLWRG